jgi:hypothetical protein
MEHHEAIRIQASERYLLGDLPPADRDSFEEHFFGCAVCAEDVRLGTTLADNAKAVFEDPEMRRTPAADVRSQARWGWLRWPQLAPVAAALAFAAVAGIEAVELSALRQPQVVSAAVIPPASKGDRPVIHTSAGDRFVELSFNVDAINSPGPYQCKLVSEAGQEILSLVAPPPPPGAPLAIRLSRSSLAPGRYIMMLRVATAEGAQRELERYPFTLERN